MTQLFISHSSKNNAEALALSQWLTQDGWDDQFLDLDPQRGITAGERCLREGLKKVRLDALSSPWPSGCSSAQEQLSQTAEQQVGGKRPQSTHQVAACRACRP